LAPIGIFFDSRVRSYVRPLFIYVLLYSILGHKELRFIFYAIPIFNVAGAVGLVRMYVTFINKIVSNCFSKISKYK
jgi:alpha-1,6-mannosyltransferase